MKRKVVKRVLATMLAAVVSLAMLPITGWRGTASAAVSGRTISGVNVSASLKITKQPKNLSVRVGSTAQFTVAVTGQGTITYQWQTKAKGAAEWKNSTSTYAKSATFKLAAQAGHDGYQFRCIIREGNNSPVTSDAATLTVLPKILEQTSDVTAWEYDEITLSVKADGVKDLSYQWQIKSPNATVWKNSKNASAKKANFVLTVKTEHDGYQFRCIVTDKNGNKAYSGHVTLTVSTGGPIVISQPKSLSVKVGETAEFTFSVIGAQPMTFQWFMKDPGSSVWKASSNKTAIDATLKLKAQAAHNGYMFRCVMCDTYGNPVCSNDVELTVK